MSEFGEVGYLPDQSVEASCYSAVEDCNIVIVIVGKRYGSIGEGNKSVTHNECAKAFVSNIPVYCFVESDALTVAGVYDANHPNDIVIPGYDGVAGISKLLNDIRSQSSSNAIIPYGSGEKLRIAVKQQLAHLFAVLLSRNYGRLNSDLAEILAEVKTIRSGMDQSDSERNFFLAMRYLLNHRESELVEISALATNDFDRCVDAALESDSLEEYFGKIGITHGLWTSDTVRDENGLVRRPVPPDGYMFCASSQSGEFGWQYMQYTGMSDGISGRLDAHEMTYREISKQFGDLKKSLIKV